ncbi:MAG: hypothetical protein ABSC56_13315 [Solirubrobacteraceae bacterium]|jgi:hypothetical protein
MIRGRVALTLAAAVLIVSAAPAMAAVRAEQRVILAIVPASGAVGTQLAHFEAAGLDELGLMTASVGGYSEEQTLLDVTQGAQVRGLGYAGAFTLLRGRISSWSASVARAHGLQAANEPGLLAGSVPGGAGYAAVAPGADAVLAATPSGRIAAISLGANATLTARAIELSREHRLVVVDLTSPSQLRLLAAGRRRGELLLALERPPDGTGDSLLLALGADGLGARASLSSPATRTAGLVAAGDLAPTILRWLDLAQPSAMTGQAVTLAPARSAGQLAGFADRLAAIASRRAIVLLTFLAALLVLAVVRGGRDTLRLGGLAALWSPVTVLAGAALAPSAAVEALLVVGGALALAYATDSLVRWPRAAAVPAVACLALYSIDLLAGSGLVERSLLGSDPISAERFFGAGNELVAVLAVELLVALAAGIPQRAAGRREIAAVIVCGGLLTGILAWGRGGANVGAIFTVGGATAGAALTLLPGALRAGHVALAAAALLVALGLVAALDLALGGGAQLTSQILHARSAGAVLEVLRRRASEGWDTLTEGPVAAAVALCAVLAAVLTRRRERVLAPAGGANAWGALFAGALSGSILGSLAADSGPRVLLIGCVAAGCALAYLHGAPKGGRERSGAALYSVLTACLPARVTLRPGSGIPRPDPPNFRGGVGRVLQARTRR